VVIGIMFAGRHLDQVAVTLSEPVRILVNALYYCLPHLEFYDVRDLVIHNWPPVAFQYVGLALLYAVFYMAVFLIGACLVFRRKPVN